MDKGYKIRYKKNKISFRVMTWDAQVSLSIRDFLIYTRNYSMERYWVSDYTQEIEYLIDTYCSKRMEYQAASASETTLRVFSTKDIEIDSEDVWTLNDQIFSVLWCYMEFYRRMFNRKYIHIENQHKELVSFYWELIGQLSAQHDRVGLSV